MNEISIVYSCNDKYIPFAYMSILSLLDNVKQPNKYHIYILCSDVSVTNKKFFQHLEKENVSIQFVDVTQIKEKYPDNLFSLSCHFSVETYYRFFLAQLFPNLDKVLYIDVDTLIQKDVAELYCFDVSNNYIGATRDCEIIRDSHTASSHYKDYIKNTLGIKNINQYFQAGVMIVNLKKWRQDNLQYKLLERLKEIRTPLFVDQDILNSVCQDKVAFIEQNWNYTWHIPLLDKTYYKNIGKPYNRDFELSKENPYIIHFCGQNFKPMDYPFLFEAKLFWKYARQSPFYEELLFQTIKKDQEKRAVIPNIKDIANYSKNRFNYYRCRLLANVTFGKMRKHYKNKKKELKAKIKAVRRFLKS